MSALSFRQVVFCDPLRPRGPAVNHQPIARPAVSLDGESEDASRDRAWLRSIFRRAGLSMEAYKPASLQRRKQACLRALGVGSIVQARLLLARRPDRLAAAMSALLIGVTDFFRDPQVFAALAGNLGPPGRPLRVWSAGCSTGAELYSVAMLLEEAGSLDAAELLGTDCRSDAISYASAGRYDLASAGAIPGRFRQRSGFVDGTSFQIADRLRRAVQFRIGDVLAGIEPGPWDLILCRNLSIYLRPEVVGKLWIALDGALGPGGMLMLGKAERPAGATRLRPIGPMLWRRTDRV